jgi:hypothetical protein
MTKTNYPTMTRALRELDLVVKDIKSHKHIQELMLDPQVILVAKLYQMTPREIAQRVIDFRIRKDAA